MSRALLIVDIQPDFCEGGSLPVTGGNAVAAAVARYVDEAGADYALIATSQDWHNPDSTNGGHFAAEPDYRTTWPAHCIAGTPGAELHSDLAEALTKATTTVVGVHKGQDAPAYSAFEGTASDGRALAQLLTDAGVTEVDVVGIATDHCVRATALDALAAGLDTTLLAGLHAGVAADTTDAALTELADAGADVGRPLAPATA